MIKNHLYVRMHGCNRVNDSTSRGFFIEVKIGRKRSDFELPKQGKGVTG